MEKSTAVHVGGGSSGGHSSGTHHGGGGPAYFRRIYRVTQAEPVVALETAVAQFPDGMVQPGDYEVPFEFSLPAEAPPTLPKTTAPNPDSYVPATCEETCCIATCKDCDRNAFPCDDSYFEISYSASVRVSVPGEQQERSTHELAVVVTPAPAPDSVKIKLFRE